MPPRRTARKVADKDALRECRICKNHDFKKMQCRLGKTSSRGCMEFVKRYSWW